ncbi:hypothetical protein CHN49_06505 [Pseudomonas putida]|nr:hypothetical protein CHN49_06505 [Pseudomonas putida]
MPTESKQFAIGCLAIKLPTVIIGMAPDLLSLCPLRQLAVKAQLGKKCPPLTSVATFGQQQAGNYLSLSGSKIPQQTC